LGQDSHWDQPASLILAERAWVSNAARIMDMQVLQKQTAEPTSTRQLMTIVVSVAICMCKILPHFHCILPTVAMLLWHAGHLTYQ
jgi:hypothetical protein